MYLSNLIIHVSIFRAIKTMRFRQLFFISLGNKTSTYPILKKVFNIPKRVEQNKYQIKDTVVGYSFCCLSPIFELTI